MNVTLSLQSQGRQSLAVRVEHAQRDARALARVTDRALVLAARTRYREERDAKVQQMADEARLREAQAGQQAIAARRAARTKRPAVTPSVPVTRALGLSTSEYVVTFCRGGEISRTEHAERQGAADRVVALAHRHGVTYSQQEREDLAEALRLHLTEYVWDDVRVSADAHYTLTVQYLGGAR
jgi:hypothetical protein